MTVTEPAPLPTRRENPFDPPPEFRLLRADRPVSRLAFPGGGEGWLVTRADEVRRVLIDPPFSSGHQNLSPVRAIPRDMRVMLPGLFIQMDPPEHTRYRRALTAQFTMAQIRAMRAHITEIVSDHLDAMVFDQDERDGTVIVLVPRPTDALWQAVRTAAERCPTQAIGVAHLGRE